MTNLRKTILSAAQALPEGGLISPKEFLHLASRAAVDQALARLAREGKLLRIRRGVYALPVVSRFGPRPPSTEAVVEAIASTYGATVVPHGAAEANALGLTTQVPTREIFLTSGPARRLRLGNRTVELRPGRHWQLLHPGRLAGKVIRALSWLGPEQASSALQILRAQLPAEEWAALQSVRATLPGWMARAVSEVDADG